MGDHKGTLQIEHDDIKGFGGTFGTLRFDEKSLFNTLLGFTSYWDYQPANAIYADSPGVYTSDKNLNLKTINKFQLKCDFIDGSIINGVQQPVFYRVLS